ncbi:hypothetical protein J3R95_11075 [Enterococcus faecium]|uniref:hypothetical protein n=1 Tax=Enterococcus faecium TaxID=1352 RepID=UPI00201E9E22|nr:hypothetical protein [Enterococcus faecium]MCL6148038.1 hypothetical protein [Enterococcus faecium]MCL6150594.1 hypothetical protein [Enterococcus faecium]MCL6163740.1 hypothetical protein [Enterococcus faecium]
MKIIKGNYYKVKDKNQNRIYRAQDSVPVTEKYVDKKEDEFYKTYYCFLVFDLSDSDRYKIMSIECLDVKENILIPATKEEMRVCEIIERISNYEAPEEYERGALWSISKVAESISHAKGLLEISTGRLSELSSIVMFKNQGDIFNKLDEVDQILKEVETCMEIEKVKFVNSRGIPNEYD